MLGRKLRGTAIDQRGFTLLEILIVMLLIGVLAAIALPAFLGQKDKGEDASAKSDARNAVSQVESCYVEHGDYRSCEDADSAMAGAGLAAGVSVSSSGATAYSVAQTSGSGIRFTVAKGADGTITRTCNRHGEGGCPASGAW
jgi:type IV pilus assembly protein PilA